MEPGIIALDLDGTTICNSGPHVKNIPPKIEQCLSTLYQQGWTVFFVTGRSSSISKYFLKNCSFPYYLAGQNGSIITHQPSNQIIFTRYLAHELIPQLEFFFSGQALDFVIYSGYHNQDTCYYQRKNFPKDLFDTIQELEKEFQDPWVEVNSYRNLCPSGFPSFKCYGLKQAVEKASNLLKEKFHIMKC